MSTPRTTGLRRALGFFVWTTMLGPAALVPAALYADRPVEAAAWACCAAAVFFAWRGT